MWRDKLQLAGLIGTILILVDAALKEKWPVLGQLFFWIGLGLILWASIQKFNKRRGGGSDK